MTPPDTEPASRSTHSHWVRLRTLVMLRWLAILGQFAAITAADMVVGLSLDLVLCYLAVGASVVTNMVAVLSAPETKRLSESEALLTLLFDLTQLAFLLYLTGGITNPFALLMLAPITISATALRLRSTLFLGATAIGLVTLLTFFHVPLRFKTGELLTVPPLLVFGFWLALVIGILFIGFYSRRVAAEIHTMSDALLATQAALSREQKLTDLGGVVAAAAHELGTPLATIKLVSTELADELHDRPDLREDAELIGGQADRCRDILRSMGRAGKDDLHLRHAPLAEVLREAAEPHAARGKDIRFSFVAEEGAEPRQPEVLRYPEVIHGIRNLIQNAVDFASQTVWVEALWNDRQITLRITDDGPGFPPPLLGRIGEPFVRQRRGVPTLDERPGYEGMGLGLFIAKTLLERTGARLRFANLGDAGSWRLGAGLTRPDDGPDGRSGAQAEVTWPRERICTIGGEALGENQPFPL
ncbi:sensor histidine kinase RegB [Alkalilacustris brevis]|uniref:sensor histidine kinase RegB n=1 Tax=Alkalilacustris brevis TaxID=2026338 RepID=UPI000E0DCC43|nr:ActS/PrrB/RegB family redox-sensitive histidine kinase [Alkalilacustris brevis]